MKKNVLKTIALAFDPSENAAPRVVAKGEDSFAKTILAAAEKNGIEIIQDENLADLLDAVPCGKEIPAALYSAVAVLYSYFYKIDRKMQSK